MSTDDPHDLNRFVRAQKSDYAVASPRSAADATNVGRLPAARRSPDQRDGAGLCSPQP
jgi:hypothetical protein